MTIEPEWRSVSISSVWREEPKLSAALEGELSWPGRLGRITEPRDPKVADPARGHPPSCVEVLKEYRLVPERRHGCAMREGFTIFGTGIVS